MLRVEEEDAPELPEAGRSSGPRLDDDARSSDEASDSDSRESESPSVPATSRRSLTMNRVARIIERLRLMTRLAAWRRALRAALRR